MTFHDVIESPSTIRPRYRVWTRGRPSHFEGTHVVSGFKHSLVLAYGAGVLCDGALRVTNVPQILESRVLGELLLARGAAVSGGLGGEVCLDASSVGELSGDPETEARIHGSGYLVPGLLRRLGEVEIAVGGGCPLGSGTGGIRPSSHYVDVLSKFGARVDVKSTGSLLVRGESWDGADLDLAVYKTSGARASENYYSGASKMAILMAAGARQPSAIGNPYSKLEISTLLSILTASGVDISWEENDQGTLLRIDPRGGLVLPVGAQVRLPADLIEVVTFVTAAALLSTGDVVVQGITADECAAGLRHEIEAFQDFGVDLEASENYIRVAPGVRPLSASLVVSSHEPSPYSDSLPFFAALGAFGDGASQIEDRVWPLRFGYAAEMQKLGIDISYGIHGISIDGRSKRPKASRVAATDLRAAATLTLTALALDGDTVIDGGEHLERGYPDLVQALARLGADVSDDRQ